MKFCQKDLLEFCNKNGIVLEAYSSFAKGEVLTVTVLIQKIINEPKIGAISKRYNKTTPQVLLRWALQHNIVVIPKASSMERIKQNAELFDFEISAEDMKLLDSMNQNYHCTWHAENVV